MTNLGSNVGYVDELYARYLADPASVGEAWREFFADYRPGATAMVPSATGPAAPAPGRPADSVPPAAPGHS